MAFNLKKGGQYKMDIVQSRSKKGGSSKGGSKKGGSKKK
jgi:hypothetical protein